MKEKICYLYFGKSHLLTVDQILGGCERWCLRRTEEAESEEAAPQRHCSGTRYLEGRRIPPVRAHGAKNKIETFTPKTRQRNSLRENLTVTVALLLELVDNSGG